MEKKGFNVAVHSSGGHFVKGVKKVNQLDSQTYVAEAVANSEVILESVNHGALKIIQEDGQTICFFIQDDINEVANVISVRRD